MAGVVLALEVYDRYGRAHQKRKGAKNPGQVTHTSATCTSGFYFGWKNMKGEPWTQKVPCTPGKYIRSQDLTEGNDGTCSCDGARPRSNSLAAHSNSKCYKVQQVEFGYVVGEEVRGGGQKRWQMASAAASVAARDGANERSHRKSVPRLRSRCRSNPTDRMGHRHVCYGWNATLLGIVFAGYPLGSLAQYASGGK
ncbi:hypothetical protein C2E23DRAFT_862157 [Lenzites betulinus]|nr:hypothetical protein C2E23DRAFT_862157 [Lenzites betulinus]